MGKSGGRRKKSHNNNNNLNPTPSNSEPQLSTIPNGVSPSDTAAVFLKRAHELKEEGNRLFQSRDYVSALDQYDLALKLLPKSHPDRAVFHSNRAACLMQMRPVVDYEAVASECSLALHAQPSHPRALLRRARALEALGRHEAALQDALSLLSHDPTHRDALDLARRLRSALGNRAGTTTATDSRPSPAALGASAVRGAPTAVAGIGPCLPARPAPKKPPSSSPARRLSPPPPTSEKKVEPLKSISVKPVVVAEEKPEIRVPPEPIVMQWRPLKLFYDHDIRLARMPVNCAFKDLREVVRKRYPSARSVLVKYKDSDGDLVTITSTAELRLAELFVDCGTEGSKMEVKKKDPMPEMLRLHIVEVPPEQEPTLIEEEEVVEEVEEEVKSDGVASPPSTGDSVSDGVVDNGVVVASEEEKPKKEEKAAKCNHAECKEAEIDDWLLEFAQLFRTHAGIDPDAHVDLHELGMELCSEALEEAVTSEEAQTLFEMAACKFQEVAALAFFNWGNVHMCAARKRIPLDESSHKEVMSAQLQSAYDWVTERYALAGLKYEEALRIKPDFYEALLALGQQHFETAKLKWSFALAKKIDLSTWDAKETIELFDSAEERMSAATEMWEKVEEQKVNELKDPKKEELLLKRKNRQMTDSDGEVHNGDGQGELTAEEVAEQNAVMRSQIHLFWGNMLFERSKVEFKLGVGDWKKRLDGAVERFKLAGASEADISVVLKNHASNGADAVSDEKMRMNSGSAKTDAKDDKGSVLQG
ncbi:hypothetical protein QJS04_geneDACA023282 [Acorus gramineus]|uniref:PB1 domain-containing protein n=1 Tax=Acorus gramineus TaxID=55184 RepID=A0AAV8ZZB3_ACOGR|nr:hypothetical protein QJS04_geneDACA023282 [Acorus gramineus]